MNRKHGYNYGYIKHKYPNVYKLPETEIKPMIEIVHRAPDMTQAETGLMTHIKQNEPKWNMTYFSKPNVNKKNISNTTSPINSNPYLQFNGQELSLMEK